MLEVQELSVSYGAVNALRSVSFTAEKGHITAVLGANGAGKTTLLRTISGLTKPKDGSVRFMGQEILGSSVESIARRGVAHVPEGRGVIEELTVEENLRVATLWCFGPGNASAPSKRHARIVPSARRVTSPSCRDAVGRGTANAGTGTGADHSTSAPASRRAFSRAGPDGDGTADGLLAGTDHRQGYGGCAL